MSNSPSNSSLVNTIRERADDILSACSGITGGSSSACMKHAAEILKLTDLLATTEETEVPFGPMDRPEPHPDGVSRRRQDVYPVCYKAKTENRDAEHARVQAQLSSSAAARARTQKARRKTRAKVRK